MLAHLKNSILAKNTISYRDGGSKVLDRCCLELDFFYWSLFSQNPLTGMVVPKCWIGVAWSWIFFIEVFFSQNPVTGMVVPKCWIGVAWLAVFAFYGCVAQTQALLSEEELIRWKLLLLLDLSYFYKSYSLIIVPYTNVDACWHFTVMILKEFYDTVTWFWRALLAAREAEDSGYIRGAIPWVIFIIESSW